MRTSDVTLDRKHVPVVPFPHHDASAAANLFSLIASVELHELDVEEYLGEIVHVVPYWPRDRFLELAPKYWRATRARVADAQLAREVVGRDRRVAKKAPELAEVTEKIPNRAPHRRAWLEA